MSARRWALDAGWLAMAIAAVIALDATLTDRPLAALALGALVADVARQQTRADDPFDASARARAKRVLAGARLGAIAGLLPIVVGALAGSAWVKLVAPAPLALASGAGRALAEAFRDETLGRGVPLALAARAGVSPRVARAYVVALAVAPHVGRASAAAVACVALAATLGAVLWSRAGIYAACAARAALLVAIDVVARAEPLDVAWRAGALAPLGRASGTPGWLLAASLAIATALAVAVPGALVGARPREVAAP